MNVRRLFAATVLAGIALTGLTVPAQAATAPTKGPGLTLTAHGQKVFVGPYRVGGRLLYCTDEGALIGDGTVRKGPGASKLTAEARARVNLVVNTWGDVTDNRSGARVKLAVATLVAPFDPAMRRNLPEEIAQMTPTDRAEITRMVNVSATHAPYRASVNVSRTVAGQSGKATVTVLGSNGRPATGRAVTFTMVGGQIVSAGTATDTRGQATAAFTATANAQTVTATVTAPSSTAVWQNTPTAGHQLMVGGGFMDTVKVTACSTVCPVKATASVDLECVKPTLKLVNVTFTVENLPGNYRGIITVAGTRNVVDLTPGETRTVTASAKVGQDVTIGYEILSATGTVLVADTLGTVAVR